MVHQGPSEVPQVSILDYFTDWERSGATVYGPTTAYDPATGTITETYGATGATLLGIKYNRSAAERYFSERWAPDVSEVYVVDATATALALTVANRLAISTQLWAIDSIVNVAEQNEVLLIGLKVFA